MNKNALIVISLGAAAFLTALFYIYFSKLDKNIGNQTGTPTVTSDTVPDKLQEQLENTIKSGVNENEIVYNITTGEATYSANKQFLGKDAEDILGRTEDIQGTGYWNKDTNEVEISAVVNLATLTTNNSKRDSEVQVLFKDKNATFRLEPAKVDIQMGQEFQQDITGTMIINGISQNVTFNTKGVVNENDFSLEGTTNMKMSDFGITSPSLAGVFTVADELSVNFKVSGKAVTTE